tara:strand:- start:294 stop:1118 length:825 start_codon:yes stop_codon:yes gene_type:complete
MKWSDKNVRPRWVLEKDETLTLPSDLDYVITGIPRSGTSLMSTILSLSEDSFCFNEIHYKISTLPLFFSEMRKRIETGLPVINKINKIGTLVTDTQREIGVKYSHMHVGNKSFPLKIGSKVNVPYLNNINQIAKLDYKIVAMIRNPEYTLASWNDAKVSNIPEANVDGVTQHNRWGMFSFSTESKLERQLIIWEHYANIINSISSNILIVNYESLVQKPIDTISKVCDFLAIKEPQIIPEIVDGNSIDKYPSINEIINQISEIKSSKLILGNEK